MRRILIINDNIDICKEIKYSLKNAGTDAYYATSVDDALNCFARYSYELVIMDTQFAEANGIKLVEIMRQAKPVPILVLSSGHEKSEHVWPRQNAFDIDAAVKNRISELRAIMGKDYIETVWGFGYRFNPKPIEKEKIDKKVEE